MTRTLSFEGAPGADGPTHCRWLFRSKVPGMTVIAVVNRKGGSGKSTLATHLAAHVANTGASVMLGDIDRQQSTRTWLRQRNAAPSAERPEIKAWAVDPRFFARPPSSADHVVLDTPGGLTGLDLARVVMYADADTDAGMQLAV